MVVGSTKRERYDAVAQRCDRQRFCARRVSNREAFKKVNVVRVRLRHVLSQRRGVYFHSHMTHVVYSDLGH